MEQTSTVDGCLLVGVSSNLGKNIFSLEELVIDSPKDKESSNEEKSNSTPVAKEGSHCFEKRMYWYSFIFLGDAWAWMSGLFLLLLPVCLFCI